MTLAIEREKLNNTLEGRSASTHLKETGTMREIRFRGKTKYGVWVYGGFFKLNDTAYIVKVERQTFEPYSEIATMEEVDSETVGQYTGLKDRNGREIYEGDIVLGYYYDTFSKKEIEIISYVRWDESGYWTFDGERRFCGGYLTDVKDIRVAGNIYDNAELLKGEETA